jgi:hypothetical protein
MRMATLRRPDDRIQPVARTGLPAIVLPLFLILFCTSGLAARDRASARADGTRAIGDWTLAPSRDGNGCFLTRDYDRAGGTTLLLGVDVDGTNRLSVLNANWSIRSKDRLKLNFRLSNSSYPAHFAIGIVSDGKQGFVTSFGVKFPAYFAASQSLDISRGDVPVERLSLDGADPAVTALGKCVEGLQPKPTAAATGRLRSDGIPSDPFAPVAARDSAK